MENNKSKTRLYIIWNGMKGRCYRNKNRDNYKFYGEHGIKVCDEWLNSFESFRDWALSNGYRDNLTIDRIKSDGNYEPNNCQWKTMKEQSNNTKKNILITFCNETKTASQWAEIYKIPANTFINRIKNLGWSIEKALITPVRRIK
jgi:hypothetical protein